MGRDLVMWDNQSSCDTGDLICRCLDNGLLEVVGDCVADSCDVSFLFYISTHLLHEMLTTNNMLNLHC